MNLRGSNLIALFTLVAALGASVVLTPMIAASAGRHQLVYATRVEDGMTKEEALGVAAGAFRGVFVNYLWLRATEMKNEGKYYEAVDLARTITKLQPRFPRVWAFHAWNLAYNISVATQTPRERWQWVNSGIRLLRDEGIPANPNDMLLHKELAWIYIHKVQGRMDDANNYYKVQFADEWASVMGPYPQRGDLIPPAKEGDKPGKITQRQQLIDAMVEYLTNIQQAPETLEEVRKDPLANELFETLIKKADLDVRRAGDRAALLRVRAMNASVQRRMSVMSLQAQIPENMKPLVDVMNDPKFAPAWPTLIRHLRKRTLVDNYHMELDRMIRYTQKYGPLDWRHPAAHALYWSARGVEQGLARVQDANRSDYDFINTDRISIHALQELYRTGQIIFDITLPGEYFQSYPSEDFIESYQANLEELSIREAEQMKKVKGADMEQRIWSYYRAGYENFVADAAVYLYRLGEVDRAQKLRLSYYAWKGAVKNDDITARVGTGPLEDYIEYHINDRTNTPNVALQEVQGSLRGAYLLGLLAGDEGRFRNQFEYAKRFHKAYWDQQYRLTNVDPNDPRMKVMDTDFRVEAARVLRNTIAQLGPVDGALIYQRAPGDLQNFVYEILDATERPRDEKGVPNSPGFERMFPEPPGYKDFAKLRAVQKNKVAPAKGNQEMK
jgi:hypothetical protein